MIWQILHTKEAETFEANVYSFILVLLNLVALKEKHFLERQLSFLCHDETFAVKVWSPFSCLVTCTVVTAFMKKSKVSVT